MKNEITITPDINLAMTLDFSSMGEVIHFNKEYFKEPFDIKAFTTGMISMNEYLEKQIAFHDDIDPKYLMEFWEALNSGDDGFWQDNLIKIERDFDEYILSETNVSFLDYYKEEIDKMEDNRIHAIVHYLMMEIRHTPETLKLLSRNNELFKLILPHITLSEKTNIFKMNKLNIENGEDLTHYAVELLSGKYEK